ncbi:MAG: AMP-binding protein [Akkermansia sp.]
MSKRSISGLDNLPQSPSFFIPNRMNYEALYALYKLLGGSKHVAFLVEDVLCPEPRMMKLIRAKKRRSIRFNFREANRRELRERIMAMRQEGYHVLFVPGVPNGPIGSTSDVPMPFMMQLSALHIAPVPLFIGMYRNNLHQLFNTEGDYSHMRIHVCPKLQSGPHMGDRLLQSWMEAGEYCFKQSPLIYKSVARLLVEGMRRNPNNTIVDGLDETELTYSKLLGIVMAMARKLKSLVAEPRVGIILPPGKGGIIANYACVLAGISPVNINFTSSEGAFKGIIEQSGIKKFITARAFMNKLPEFPWPHEDSLIHLDKTLKGLGMKGIAPWVAFAKVAPMSLINSVFRLDSRKGDDEVALLFTSGSSGDPKGVLFRNSMVVSNLAQLLSRIKLPLDGTVLCSLPIFHSLGLSVTTLAPALLGLNMVTYPSPLDAKRLNELIEKYHCDLVISTPTFARSMLRRADKDTYRSVKCFLVGAEKLQRDLADEFYNRCGVRLLDAYGLTETTPGCSYNLPPHKGTAEQPYYMPGYGEGSVGQVLPGLSVRITDPDDDSVELPLCEQGMIWFKGPNVFAGYIGQEQLNREILQDGWFKTGDLGHVDLNGMLHLGGRRSRFSKVGGEMVPHELIEQAVEEMLNEQNGPSEGRRIAIVGVPDKQKGEAVVMISSVHASQLAKALGEIREYLVGQGLPRLWVPREILPVEAIPMLATGKMDLKNCKILAYESLGLSV